MYIECWNLVYQDSEAPHPLSPKDNRKFWILLVKIFSLKPRSFFSSGKQPHVSDYTNFVKISKNIFKKTRDYNRGMSNKSHSGRFRHDLTYSGIIKNIPTYSTIRRHIQELFGHIQNPVQPWYIKNPRIFRTRGIFRTYSTKRHSTKRLFYLHITIIVQNTSWCLSNSM